MILTQSNGGGYPPQRLAASSTAAVKPSSENVSLVRVPRLERADTIADRAALHGGNNFGIVANCRPCPFTIGDQIEFVAADVDVNRAAASERISACKGDLAFGIRARAVKHHKQDLAPCYGNNPPVFGVYGLFRCRYAPALGGVVINKDAPVRFSRDAVRTLLLRQSAGCNQRCTRNCSSKNCFKSHLPSLQTVLNLNVSALMRRSFLIPLLSAPLFFSTSGTLAQLVRRAKA